MLLVIPLGASNCPLHSFVAYLRSPLLQKCPFSEVETKNFGHPLHENQQRTGAQSLELSARSALWDGISPAVKRLFINTVALL